MRYIFDENLGWLFGLWLGDKSSYGGLSICNKDFGIITKSFQIMKSIGLTDIKAKIYYKEKTVKPSAIALGLKRLGIQKVSFYRSASCGSYCIYLYNNGTELKLVFKTLLNEFDIPSTKPKLLSAILAGIFDAEGSVDNLYNIISIEFKSGCVENVILAKILDELSITYSCLKKSNGMTLFKIGGCKGRTKDIENFYEFVSPQAAHSIKCGHLENLISGRYEPLSHEFLYLYYVQLHPLCTIKDIMFAFAKHSRENVRLRMARFVKNGYVECKKESRKYLYEITETGSRFVTENRHMTSEIVRSCYTNGSWGKGPIYKLSPFIIKCLGSMLRSVSAAGG